MAMTAKAVRERVLLVARDGIREELRGLMPTADWEVIEARSLEHARFVQDGQPCEAIIVDGGLAGPGWSEGLARLAGQVLAPVVLIGEVAVGSVLEGLRLGASWLPVEIAYRHPELLAGLLTQAIAVGQERQRAVNTTVQLRHCYGRVDRLLGLLWEAAPGEGPVRWYSQRHMLERLDEEVARTRRHGGPLSLILGELRPRSSEKIAPDQLQRLGAWLARQIAENKRRCDVAGQYGLGGFMLVLPRATAEEAAGACQRLQMVLEHPPHDELPGVHACFGTASVPADLPSVQGLLRRAEERLDQARGR
jgi:diguanylate cyclase (GGDEF)-like protein